MLILAVLMLPFQLWAQPLPEDGGFITPPLTSEGVDPMAEDLYLYLQDAKQRHFSVSVLHSSEEPQVWFDEKYQLNENQAKQLADALTQLSQQSLSSHEQAAISQILRYIR
ncbi:hypothetical protein D1Z90_15530 [Motilimonas pumila]|uniref:Uncharacterized protein n=2 Tax=Motilimonas pumila TaxID=2303987 RepID=A0A418YBR9_9GAMM|nr:hypothetical protein D1Z90_15530 [Motilimonas pumila]